MCITITIITYIKIITLKWSKATIITSKTITGSLTRPPYNLRRKILISSIKRIRKKKKKVARPIKYNVKYLLIY